MFVADGVSRGLAGFQCCNGVMEGEESLCRGAMESALGQAELGAEAGGKARVLVVECLCFVEEAEEPDGFAEVGDLRGPENFPSVVGAAVGFSGLHCLTEEVVKLFVCACCVWAQGRCWGLVYVGEDFVKFANEGVQL